MKTRACFCDLCAGDSKVRLAAARYWNDEGEKWHCCYTHLQSVKEAGLEYEEFPTKGNVDLSEFGY